MIPRSEGPWRPLSESISACEAHRDHLHDGFLKSIVDGRAPTQNEAGEHRRREREARAVARQRSKFTVQRAARHVVLAEYKRWLNE